MDTTIYLLVALGELNPAQVKHLPRRWGKNWSAEVGNVDTTLYTVEAAFEMYEDEFGEGTIFERTVAYAGIGYLPYGPEQHKPNSEESAGCLLFELAEDGESWVAS